jgi:Holliday junction resolvase
VSGGRSPKRKGSAFEREIVALLKAAGLDARRVPLSGAVKVIGFDHDISCRVRDTDQRIECKRRRRAFGTLDQMLADNFAVIIRDDHSRPMVVMDLQSFALLAK